MFRRPFSIRRPTKLNVLFSGRHIRTEEIKTIFWWTIGDIESMYIVKPTLDLRKDLYLDSPANEHLTMTMADQLFHISTAGVRWGDSRMESLRLSQEYS